MRFYEDFNGAGPIRAITILSQKTVHFFGGVGHILPKTFLPSVLLFLLTISAHSSNWYVVPGGAGSKSGVDWNNAWSSSAIGSVGAGDTIWVAGGAYSSFSLINKKGAPGNQINVYRVLSSDSIPTAAAGWSSSFDSEVVISPTLNFDGASYVTFDGRTNYGIQIPITGGGQQAISGAKSQGNSTNVFIYNVEISGPFPATGISGEMDGIYWGSLAYNLSYNIVVSNCFIHGFDTFFKMYWNSSTITRCKLWNSYGSSGQHPDIIYFYPCTNFVFSYNSVSNINGEGIFTDGKLGVICGDEYFFGNTFQNPNFCADVGLFGNLIYFVNNTIYDTATTKGASSMTAYDTNSLWANNLMCYAANAELATPQSKYNIYCANNIGGYSYSAGEVGSSGVSIAPPFTDSMLHITNTIANGYPCNAGMPIAPINGHSFNIDPDGNDRTGKWSIGAYEYGTNVVSGNGPVLSVSPLNLNFGTIPVNQVGSQTFSVQNTGGGVLAGSAIVAAPFSITNGSYSLGAGLSQLITVQFSPNTSGAVTNVVTFTVTGGNGTNAMVYGIGSAIPSPTVSAINANASDVSQSQGGLQIYGGTVVALSATASNALTYQWSYAVNGGASMVFQGGAGAIPGVNFSYGTNTIGNTYVWTLSVSNSQGSAQSQFALNVLAPPVASSSLTFAAQSGLVTAPFIIGTNGTTIYFYQLSETDGINSNGVAIYNFTITNAGNYEVQALVNAPNTGANSLYINIDSVPQDPTMVWDVALTSGFEERLVSWRGNGSTTANQFVPWIFNLATGSHQLIFYGREANTQLSDFAILPAPPTPPPPIIIGP